MVVLTPSHLPVVLSVIFFMLVSADQITMTAKPGDNVTLPCRAAENEALIAAEWSRTDLESEPLLLCRDTIYPEGQCSCFQDQVSLQSQGHGDVSLILKNVTTNDTGTYECRVVQMMNDRRKRSNLDIQPIRIFKLRVEPGNEDKRKKDGGKNVGEKQKQAENGGNALHTVGVVLFIAVVFITGFLFLYCCRDQLQTACRNFLHLFPIPFLPRGN
ncbi:hepatitis A virus cellular receptor 2 homolog [Poecilia latipinna]|uniref:hepatitis A virus cellular receptor 2 homolog n=1 Tax=Poecilia latipinna TaxID=48699 RepID=UPI00072E3E3D|nr:PREDICTED: hepatitis A virus cellular receptor 2 homolog [Poecilia latipinna]